MRNFFVLCACVALAALAGCNRLPQPKPIDPTQQRLLLLGQAYRQFNHDKRRPPKSADELLALFAQRGIGGEVLESARDGQKFVVCWGANVAVPPAEDRRRPVLAYEQSGGPEGRFVLSTMGNVELLNDAELRASLFPPGFQPP